METMKRVFEAEEELNRVEGLMANANRREAHGAEHDYSEQLRGMLYVLRALGYTVRSCIDEEYEYPEYNKLKWEVLK